MCHPLPPHDEIAQLRHDYYRKAAPIGTDDGPEKVARIEKALLADPPARERVMLELELLRLRAVLKPVALAAE